MIVFQQLNAFRGVEINEVFIEEIIQHLTGLSEGFNQYFPNDQQVKNKNELWIKKEKHIF